MAGLKDVYVTGGASQLTINAGTTAPNLHLISTNQNATVAPAATVLAGTADKATILSNGSAGTANVTATYNGLETIDFVAAGSATGSTTTALTLTSDALTTLNMTGDVAARVSAGLPGATATITGTVTSDAGAHDVQITGIQTTDNLSVSMGAGNDTVRISDVVALYTIAGGDGTDTLRYDGANTVTMANTANVSGFEAVRLDNAAPASFAMTGAGISKVTYTNAAAGTFGGLTTGGELNLNAGGTVTVAAAGAAASATAAQVLAAATYSGTADGLTVNVGQATTATGAAASTVSAVGLEQVTFNSLASSASTEARSVTFSDTGATPTLKTITVTSAIPALTTVSATTTALTTVDLSGVSGGASFSGGAATGATITGGAGNDALTGGAGNDAILGGNGSDTITGSTGADVMTGGDGADRFVIGANTTTSSFSTAASPDVIKDFVSGTDKISLAQAPSSFLGVYTNIQQALAAAATNNVANAAAFVSGENNLYVFTNANGTLNSLDTVVKLEGVTTITGSDILVGSQGTAGANSITLTAANAVVGTAGTTAVNAAETNAGTNTPAGSLNTTDFNDTVTSTIANIAGATLNGGAGTDTLALSRATAGTSALTLPATVTGFEAITLANVEVSSTATSNTYSITLSDGNVAANTVLTVTSSEDGLNFDGTSASPGVTFTATNALTTADRRLSYSGSSAFDSVTGGPGNDTMSGGDGNDTLVSGGGNDSLSGGNGNDMFNMGAVAATNTSTISGGAGVTDTIRITDTSNLAEATISGVEILDIAADQAAETITLTAAQAAALTGGLTRSAGPTNTIRASDITVTIDATTTARATGSVTLDVDAITYNVAAGAVAGVTFVGPATSAAFNVTGSGLADTFDLSAATNAVNETLIGGAGNDTFRIASAALSATDTVTGGTGTDTLTIAGNATFGAAGTHIALTGVTQIEVITIENTTTSVYVTAADTVATGNLTVTTAQTTGSLYFTSSASTAGNTVNVTGGGGDDSLTGGGLADTLSGGGGSDTLIGGTGADVINTGTGNNSVDGGEGNDSITLGSGQDTVQFTAIENATTIYLDSITGFTVGTGGDVLRFGTGDLDADGTAGMDLVDGAGTTLGTIGVGDIVLTSVATGATVVTATGGAAGAAIGMIKFSSTTSTSIASAMGSATLTIVDANHTGGAEGLLAMYYDAANSKVIIGYFSDSTADTVLTALEFVPFAELIGISATDYAGITAANIGVGG